MTGADVLARLASAGALIALLAAACGDASREEAPPAPAPVSTPRSVGPPPTPVPTSTVAPTSTPTPTAPATPTVAPTSIPTPTSTAPPTPTSTPTPALPDTFGDGDYEVGADIAPGRYRTTTLIGDCDAGSPDRPLPGRGASEIADVREGESFSTHGCGAWSKDMTPIVAPGQPFGEGAYLVGSEIAPGLYRAISQSSSCRWDMSGLELSGVHGSPSLETAGSSVVVEIRPGDDVFRSYGCGTWTRVPAPIAKPVSSFGAGAFLVGAEIAPGKYRSAMSTGSCVWARLNSFRWEAAAVYGPREPAVLMDWDSRSSRGLSIATIEPDDVGFVSYGCGVWSPFALLSAPGQPFGEGTFLVGAEVEPGLYRAAPYSDRCRWRRYDGDADDPDYIRWGWTTIVEILPTDTAFDSHDCGTWSDDLSPIVAPGQPFGEGTFLVGDEIAPGRYRAASATRDCVWRRRSGVAWLDGERLGSSTGSRGGAIVEIASTDTYFHSWGCGEWSSDFTPIVTPGQPFGDGAFLVGVEVAPGTYRAASPYCQWARLSGFSDYHGDAIDSQNSFTGLTLILTAEIAPTDLGFHSHSCGRWTLVPPGIAPGEPFGDGLFLVGTEVTPGRYRAASPTASCVWRRMAWAEGAIESGAAAEGVSALTVEIAPDDAGFSSDGCGQWTPAP